MTTRARAILRNCLRAIYIVPAHLPLLLIVLPFWMMHVLSKVSTFLAEALRTALLRGVQALPDFEPLPRHADEHVPASGHTDQDR